MMAFDEARFGLINWHRRRYCPRGFRPPYIVRRKYKWTYLYAAVDPTTGESYCMYLPGMDDGCLEIFLDGLSKAYPDQHLLGAMARRRAEPSLRADRLPGEHQLPQAPTLLTGTGPGGDGSKSSDTSCPTERSRRSLYCKRRSPRRLCPIGKSPLSSNGSPVIPGGWRRWEKRYAINRPERY